MMVVRPYKMSGGDGLQKWFLGISPSKLSGGIEPIMQIAEQS